jgi:excisionase family DNA binding protein
MLTRPRRVHRQQVEAMTVQVPSHAVQADGRVSVQEAAQILGCSEKTIRRKIKAGTLTAHRLPTSQGYEWRVELNDSPDQLPPPPAAQVNGQAAHLPGETVHLDGQAAGGESATSPRLDEPANEALLKALAFAERLQRENMELAGRVGFLQAKLQTAEEQILALTGGESGQPTETVAVAPERPAEPSPWQRLVGWVRGQQHQQPR